MNFGFDLDGVLFPWHENVYQWCRDNLDVDVSYREFWSWPDGWFGSRRNKPFIHDIVRLPELYLTPLAKKTHIKAIHRINRLIPGEIHYITARPVEVTDATKEWFQFSELPFSDNVHFTKKQGGKKEVLLKRLNCSFYVEDRVDYAESVLGVSNLFLVNRIWNEGFEHPDVVRIKDVKDIPNILERGL